MRCANCATELNDSQLYCPFCGAQQSIPCREDAVVPKKRKSKRPLGLIIAGVIVAILIILVTVGHCTNWFGFYGPTTRIVVAAKNVLDSGNFTIETNFNDREGSIQVDLDVDNRQLMIYLEQENEASSGPYTAITAVYNNYLITGYRQGQREYFYKRDISKTLDEFFDLYSDTEELDWEGLLDSLYALSDEDWEDHIQLASFEQCATAYFKNLNSNKWLKENAGYTTSRSGGVTYYGFKPDLYHFSYTSLEAFEEAFVDEDEYTDAKDKIKSNKSRLNELEVSLTFGIKGNKLVSFELWLEDDDSSDKLEFELTKLGQTKLDEEALASILGKARSLK